MVDKFQNQNLGSQQLLVNGTGPLFPTNGRGGSQGTIHANFPAGAYLIEGATTQTNTTTDGTLTIFAGDGTTSLATIPISGTTAGGKPGNYTPIGGLYGLVSDNGFATGVTASTTVTVWFRRIT